MLNKTKLFLFSLFILGFQCLPPVTEENKYRKQVPTHEALSFMKKYGYLIDDNGQSEAIYSEENLSGIIKDLQRFGGINQTGVFDNDTVKLMSSRRCGLPDILPKDKEIRRRKRFTVAQGWDKRHLTYYISNWSPKLSEEIVARNIQKALDIWAGYGRLRFTRSPTPDADIIVAFGSGYHGDSYPFDGPGLVLAHAFFPGDTQTAGSAGDIHFDNDEPWADLSNEQNNGEIVDGTDFFSVALHELGHSLGLSHSAVPTSVMFPYYKGWEHGSQTQLDYDDIMGMYSLYIQRRIQEDELAPSYPEWQPTTEEVATRRPTSTLRPYWTTPREDRTPDYRDREEITTRRSSTRKSETTTLRPYWTTFRQDREEITTRRSSTRKPEVNRTPAPYPSRPKSDETGQPEQKPPDICKGHFDAVATLRGELFIFKDEYLWRLKSPGQIYEGYPTKIHRMFPELPKEIRKIDAAYQRPNGDIILFTGKELWIYNGVKFLENSPLPLSYYAGLPDYLDGVDAVQNWAKNGKTYIYKNSRFWRYDEETKKMDDDYPKHIERWRGVPGNLNAAITWTDGITYFFKGELFWTFDNNWIMTTHTSPMPIAPIWLGCKERVSHINRLFDKSVQ
ncbi:matrix metalloproteinase-14-like isoform X2 [Anthonomus grandis grandis]|uniref:matrix metalloproteinase-14-like isoform X2 n=1 Tax=Anthonomus grandis grandis TaxID=2921223 RepID=UPI002165949E|nr:matrix metalloproteinase-14-like isoform X2 [Anthonomus grandis grandis]